MAEHLSGNVEDFVEKMNIKAKQLGMVNSEFKTPNGLPAPGQVTTARDLAKLSSSYIQHYPEALHIHSMTSYTYCKATHHNANRLLGVCPGVDGIKTGFVCASGFNLAATAKRGDVRLIAVVMGARAPWVRSVETEKLLEAGFQKMAADSGDRTSVEQILAKREISGSKKAARLACAPPTAAGDGSAAHLQHLKTAKGSGKVQGNSKTHNKSSAKQTQVQRKAAETEDSGPILKQPKSGPNGSKQKLLFVKQTMPVKKAAAAEKPEAADRDVVKKGSSPGKDAAAVKNGGSLKKQKETEKSSTVQVVSKSSSGSKQKPVPESAKKTDKTP
jgi:D-alanyl-D-alanine carboxypeptidase